MAPRSLIRSLSTDPMIQKTNEPNETKVKQIFPTEQTHRIRASDKRVKDWRFSRFNLRQTSGAKAIFGSLKYPIHNNEHDCRLLLSAKTNLARSNRLTNEEVLQYLLSPFRVEFLQGVYNISPYQPATNPQATAK